MALSKEVPEFDIDDEVLLMETGIAMDSMSNDEGATPPSVRAKSKHSASLKQHKYIDYTRALDATQLYLNEIGFFRHCSPPRKKFILRGCRKVATRPVEKRMIESNLRLVVKNRPTLCQSWAFTAGPDRRGQPGPDSRRREIRPRTRLPFLDLRHLVDPPDHRTGDHEPDPDHPVADSCGQGAERLPAGRP
nr:hypothetical protein GCM10020185_16210 [Pseudomonas brassicacearum subsp. brassicacearum]